jgi:hypothetical protein
VGVGEDGPVGADDDVAVEHQLQPAGDGGAVHRGDHGLADRRPRPGPPGRRLAQDGGFLSYLLEVDARAEGRVGAGEDGRPDLVVRLHRGHRLAEPGEQLAADRVA